MSKLEELKNMIAEDFNAATDPDRVKRLVTVQRLIEDTEKETNELLTKHNQLKEEYVKAIKSQVVTNKSPEPKDTKPKTTMDIAIDLGLDKKLNFKPNKKKGN